MAVSQTGFTVADEGYGLNFGTHVGDSLDEVNRRRAMLEVDVGAPILWLNQVHGVEVCTATSMIAKESDVSPPSADASVALNSDTALAIMTADCLPAVFVARNAEGVALGVAAAHAGWKGLLNGVLSNTALSLAQATGQAVSQVSVWLGPAIGPQSFEVGGEVREAFCLRFSGLDFHVDFNDGLNNGVQHAFKPSQNPGKWLADIYQLAKIDLNQLGVKQVEGGNPPQDTFTDLNWFSHRRAALQGRQAGRMATLVRLIPQK
ncbi:MAG: polyphenol oxidase family protein [Limnobacter sp.]|nr:polyphenol oxidase family protein [Limnobacter sp.]